MAWRCSGITNEELISNMRSASLITAKRVYEAMVAVDRAKYVPIRSLAYEDSPQTIGYGATISAPHMHAYAAEALLPFLQPGNSVLDVGSGSGYMLAVFHRLVGEQGRVAGVDHIQPLVDQATSNLKRDGLTESLERKSIQNLLGDGRKGVAHIAPFDAIHVGAASDGIPQTLVNQLNQPGRMFVPVAGQDGSGEQYIYQVDKDHNGTVTTKKICGVMYVPLTDADKQWKHTDP